MTQHVALPSPLPRVVVGEGLRLEVWEHRDVDEVVALVERSREELSAFLPWAMEPVTADDERRAQADSMQQWRAGLHVGWAITEGDAFVGMIGLHRRGGPDELEIGYWLGTDATGRGIMTRAAAMATEVAFTYDVVQVVEITHDAANHRSGAVPRRLGYARVAAYTSTRSARSETGVKVRWQMQRARWLARSDRPAVAVEP